MYYVLWDGELATCSCKNFEFWGILCRHIPSIFFYKDCYKIPSKYLPSCWQHQASDGGDEVEFQEHIFIEEEIAPQIYYHSHDELNIEHIF